MKDAAIKSERLIWRRILTPIFDAKRYPGAFYRVLNGICVIQAKSSDPTIAYLGAYGLSRSTGVELKWTKFILRQLEADEVLHLVYQGRPGRFPASERYGSPGIAKGFELGHLCFVPLESVTPWRKRGSTDPQSPVIERGSTDPQSLVDNCLERGSTDPQSKGGPQTPPYVLLGSSNLVVRNERKDGEGRKTTGRHAARARALLSPDELAGPSATAQTSLAAVIGRIASKKGLEP